MNWPGYEPQTLDFNYWLKLHSLAFGKPLVKNQQVRHTMAEIKTDIMIARTINDNAAEQYDKRLLDNETISMIKFWTAEKQVEG